MSTDLYHILSCRVCGMKDIKTFLSLGDMPLPNAFIETNTTTEPLFPLDVGICSRCNLVQLMHVIPAELMFKNYLYLPSTSRTLMNHFQNLAISICNQFKPQTDDLIVDIGSNDGSLLRYFLEIGSYTILGVDPSINISHIAEEEKHISTLNEYFTPQTAELILEKYGHASIITATNVFAHIDNIHEVCTAVGKLLKPNGVFVIEVPYLIDLFEKHLFDTIYHEHLSYFSLTPLVELFKSHNLRIFDVERMPIHGGSIRIFVGNTDYHEPSRRMLDLLIFEADYFKSLDSVLTSFRTFVFEYKDRTKALVNKIKNDGKSIVGYGAPAKCNVLLNFCNINSQDFDYIVDSVPLKQGKYTPGTHIPIISESDFIKRTPPDYCFILAWNFADEIMKKQNDYFQNGGKFIIPLPDLKIIE